MMSFEALRDRRWPLALLLLTLWVAFALRVHNLAAVPPGAHYDIAANVILAGEIAYDGYRPIFITSYTGKEVLFFYPAAGLMRLIGPGLFALRLTAALIGLLTVATTYALGRELARHFLPFRLPGSNRAELTAAVRAAGVLTAGVLAVNFAHLVFSRLGFRVISQPLLQALTLLALLVALRRAPELAPRARLAAFALAGVLLGLTAYTYLAVRLFPFVIAIFWLPLLRHAWRELGLTTLVAAVVVAPLALFFARNPETFWVRIGQVSDATLTLRDYAASFGQTLSMTVWQGDPYIRFNIPGLPLFDLLSGGLIILGLVALAVEWEFDTSDRKRALQIAVVLLLLAATPIMLLPSALAIGEIVPSNLRALGVFPLIGVPIVLGLYWLWFGRVRLPFTPFALLCALALLVGGSVVTAGNFFGRWATDPALFYANDGDLVAVADLLATRPADETPYVAALHYRHPTLAMASPRYSAIKWLLESSALVMPPGQALLVYPHSSPPPAWLAARLPAAIAAPAGPDGSPLYQAFDPADIALPAPAMPLAADFGGVIALEGYTLEAAGSATPTVRLFWRINATTDRPYVPFVHIVDVGGLRWAQREANAYPAEQWSAGEVVIQDVTLTLPPGMPGGPFTLVIGLFDGADRLALRAPDGRFAGSALQIDGVRLAGNPAPLPQPPASVLERSVTPGLTLIGYTAAGNEVEAGSTWPLTLRWRAEQPLPRLRLRYSATDPNGRASDWLITDPARGQYPFDQWATPQGDATPRVLVDVVDLVVPSVTVAGSYSITLHVEAPEQPETPLFSVELGTLRVVASNRSFELPSFATPTDAVFGDGLIALPGYTLEPAGDGTRRLTLIWQALAAPERDYTVFVHLLRPDGTCCAWQIDAQPHQNGYPTGRWLAGEVVSDEYSIVLPGEPGVYPLEIGLYRAEDGVRLPVTTSGAAGPDYLLLQPVEVGE